MLRVVADLDDGGASRWIAKIPAGGNQSLLEHNDPSLVEREARFFSSPLPRAIPVQLSTPPDAGGVRYDGRDWIFMRDVAEAIDHRWTPADVHHVARGLALLHIPVVADHPSLLGAPGWSGTATPPTRITWRRATATSACSVWTRGSPACSRPVRSGGCTPAGTRSTGSPPRLAGSHPPCSTATSTCATSAWPTTGTWCSLTGSTWGPGPVGIDLAMFVSLYQLFGGTGELDERALLTDYATALSEVAGRGLHRDVELGFALCHLTWGLHLRLGHGVRSILPNKSSKTGMAGTPACRAGGRYRIAD